MSATDVSICNSAIILLGCEEMVAFDDGTAEAKVASQLYQDACEALICETEWTFATGQAKLDRLSDTPEVNYEYAYQLPSNLLTVSAVTPDYIDYDLFENNHLYTDFLGDVYVDYKFRPDESKFPAYFRQYLVLHLASLFAIPLTEDASKANQYASMADREGKKARLADARQRKNRGLKRFPLTSVRG
jgi:hypothetical protein